MACVDGIPGSRTLVVRLAFFLIPARASVLDPALLLTSRRPGK
jgi:hypothetical protein